MSKLEALKFENATLKAVPVVPFDPATYMVSRRVPGACFVRTRPQPLNNPKLVASSETALALLGLDPTEVNRGDFADFFSGNREIPGTEVRHYVANVVGTVHIWSGRLLLKMD